MARIRKTTQVVIFVDGTMVDEMRYVINMPE